MGQCEGSAGSSSNSSPAPAEEQTAEWRRTYHEMRLQEIDKRKLLKAVLLARDVLMDISQWSTKHCDDCVRNRWRVSEALESIRKLAGYHPESALSDSGFERLRLLREERTKRLNRRLEDRWRAERAGGQGAGEELR